MAPTRFKHNKKRNSGLLYEFLVRKITESLLEKDQKSYKTSYNILKKYFSEGSPLREEKNIFDVVFNNVGKVDKDTAKEIVRAIVEESRSTSRRLLDIKKSNLIKEVHKAFGKQFFSNFRIDDYKTYASIQLLINHSRNQGLVESVDRIQLENTIVNCLMRNEEQKENVVGGIDFFTYKLALKKFDDKYSNGLNEGQRKILKAYIKSFFSKDENYFPSFIKEEISDIKNTLVFHSKENFLKEDSEMKKKYETAIKKLDGFEVCEVNEEMVENLMLFRKLVEEINSNE